MVFPFLPAGFYPLASYEIVDVFQENSFTFMIFSYCTQDSLPCRDGNATLAYHVVANLQIRGVYKAIIYLVCNEIRSAHTHTQTHLRLLVLAF